MRATCAIACTVTVWVSLKYGWRSASEAACGETVCLCRLKPCRETVAFVRFDSFYDAPGAGRAERRSNKSAMALFGDDAGVDEFGDWMPKYLAFVARMDKLCKRNAYHLNDSEQDALRVHLRRNRATASQVAGLKVKLLDKEKRSETS